MSCVNIFPGFLRTAEEEQDLEFLHAACSKTEENLEEMHLDWPRFDF